jgi:hypothetical protein
MQHDDKVPNATGVIVSGGSTARIEKCTLLAYTGDGVEVKEGSFLRASGSTVKSCARGIRVFGKNSFASVERCIFDQACTGIHVFEDAEIRLGFCEFSLSQTAIEATQARGKIHNCEFKGTAHSNILAQDANLDCTSNSQSFQQKGTTLAEPIKLLASTIVPQTKSKFEDTQLSSAASTQASCVSATITSTAQNGMSPRLARWTAGWSL